jgi:hypothetical protein
LYTKSLDAFDPYNFLQKDATGCIGKTVVNLVMIQA